MISRIKFDISPGVGYFKMHTFDKFKPPLRVQMNVDFNDEICRLTSVKTQNQEVKDEIKSKFKLEMPQDFYDFWEFCTTLNANHPEGKQTSPQRLKFPGFFPGIYRIHILVCWWEWCQEGGCAPKKILGNTENIERKKLKYMVFQGFYHVCPPDFIFSLHLRVLE